MINDIKTCLHLLKSGSVDKDTYQTVLNWFCEFSSRTEDVASNREDTATVFYLLLSTCQKFYEIDTSGQLPSVVQNKLISCFSNIERLYREANAHESQLSYVKTIWFLSELKTKATGNRVGNIDYTLLKESAEPLLDVLDDIRFLFDLKDDNNTAIFPINKVIAAVISHRDFMSSKRGIKKEDIRVLQLAVRLFTSQESEVLNSLRNRCNLGFIDFLTINCEIIDTVDFLNYQYNGTIIFYNADDRKVLIRSENKEYFIRNVEFGHTVEYEKDYDDNIIGWFVIYPLDSTDSLIDFSDLMKNQKTRIEFLELMFDGQYYNVFLQKSIVRKDDGRLLPINQYCNQDNTIIKGKLNDREGKIVKTAQLMDHLQEYRICSVKAQKMNYVTFGLCLLLLSINNSGVDSLGINQLIDTSWYQEQVINNWIDSVDEDSVIAFINIWYNQLQYCDKNVEFDKVLIPKIDVLPLSQSLEKIYHKIWPTLKQDERVFCGTVVYENDQYILDVSSRDTVSSSEMKKKGITIDDVLIDDLDDEEKYYRWESMIGSKIYFLFSPIEKSGHIVNTGVAKTIAGIEWILKESLSYDVGRLVTDIEYEETAKRMRLYSDAYKDVARKTKLCRPEDIDPQIYLRILHNMIWSKINKDNKDDYFYIIRSHQIADFEEIDKDQYFLRNEDTTLYLPKDSYEQGSVLSDIYDKRLKKNAERDNRSLYQSMLTQDDAGYYLINNNRVERIIVLTDNFITGTSTKASLCAYLELTISGWEKRIQEAAETMHRLYCYGEQVNLRKIIEKNGAKLSVHGYYGTDEGCMKIDDFLNDNDINFDASSYSKKITKTAEDIISEAKAIWGDKIGKTIKPHHKLYVREYNMPKSTVFPDGMCGDPNLAINLFVSRPELNQRNG